MAKLKKIALLMSKSIGYNRDVIEGIYAFSQRHHDWVFFDAPPHLALLEYLEEWQPDGIIGHIFDSDVADCLAQLDVPIVNTTDSLAHLNYSLSDVHHFEVGVMAGNYLKSLGIQNFGYLGSGQLQYSKQRCSGFADTVDSTVATCHVEYLPRLADMAEFKIAHNKIREWVGQLAKPVGVFCSNDVPARDLTDLCREEGLRVPEDVAILGVDNDLVECRLSRPPLSSIEIPAAKIGYNAAKILHQLINNEDDSAVEVFTPSPIRVVERESTSMNAVADDEVRKVLLFIQESFATMQSLEEIMPHVSLGRRSIELRVKKVTGFSMLEILQSKRIEYAKALLTRNKGTMSNVAEACGYQSSRTFSQAFKKIVGCSPTSYARSHML